jgi:hypothetical protein
MIVAHHLHQPTRSGVAWQQKRAAFYVTGTYLAFQLLRFTARHVAIPSRALLPHVFTLTGVAAGGLFSVALAVAHPDGAFPLGSRMPFAARTFLPEGKTNRAAERFAAAKIGFSVESCKLPVIS